MMYDNKWWRWCMYNTRLSSNCPASIRKLQRWCPSLWLWPQHKVYSTLCCRWTLSPSSCMVMWLWISNLPAAWQGDLHVRDLNMSRGLNEQWRLWRSERQSLWSVRKHPRHMFDKEKERSVSETCVIMSHTRSRSVLLCCTRVSHWVGMWLWSMILQQRDASSSGGSQWEGEVGDVVMQLRCRMSNPDCTRPERAIKRWVSHYWPVVPAGGWECDFRGDAALWWSKTLLGRPVALPAFTGLRARLEKLVCSWPFTHQPVYLFVQSVQHLLRVLWPTKHSQPSR